MRSSNGLEVRRIGMEIDADSESVERPSKSPCVAPVSRSGILRGGAGYLDLAGAAFPLAALGRIWIPPPVPLRTSKPPDFVTSVLRLGQP